jgi:hypothetical protein
MDLLVFHFEFLSRWLRRFSILDTDRIVLLYNHTADEWFCRIY